MWLRSICKQNIINNIHLRHSHNASVVYAVLIYLYVIKERSYSEKLFKKEYRFELITLVLVVVVVLLWVFTQALLLIY